MADVILHHYPMSPFAEKVRLILGFKKLAWKSAIIPRVMPKPDLVALTGGYRRTPVMQIGADIYCDTALIARKLEQIAPSPSLYPNAHAVSAHSICQWADSALFQMCVTTAFQPAVIGSTFSSPEEMKAFVDDRAAMRKGSTVRRMPMAEVRPALATSLQRLDAQLADGRAYALGDAPTIADFSMYHPLWFLRVRPLVLPLLQPHKHLMNWMDRVAAFGHGTSSEISSTQAIEIANRAQASTTKPESDADNFKPGDAVEVLPTDYAFDPVAGELVSCNLDEIAVRRRDARAGEVVVHFPRLNYEIRKPAA